MRHRAAKALAPLSLLLLLVAGCAPEAGGQVRVLTGDGLAVLPAESLTDWVTYVDAVVIAKVTSKEQSAEPVTPDEEESGEGYAVQLVTFDVLDTLWHPKDYTAPPESFTTSYNAFVWENGDRDKAIPLVEANAVRFEVGGTYLLPLVDYATFDEWAPILPSSVLPFEDGIAGKGETILGGDNTPAPHAALSAPAQQLWGLGRQEIVDMLNATAPDPYATPFVHLPPEEQYQQALRAARADESGGVDDPDTQFDD